MEGCYVGVIRKGSMNTSVSDLYIGVVFNNELEVVSHVFNRNRRQCSIFSEGNTD